MSNADSTRNPHILALAAAEARAAHAHGWADAQYDLDEGKRAARYGYRLHESPHEPTMAELLAIEDDERAGGILAITPQPDTAICSGCGGSGRARTWPDPDPLAEARHRRKREGVRAALRRFESSVLVTDELADEIIAAADTGATR